MEGKNFIGMSLQKLSGIIFALLMLALCVKFYSSNIQTFPWSIHAWAQGDRYALALNFQKHGFNLFHPHTYNLKPQFPAKFPVINETGITQVDCPIHEYILAIIMTAIGNSSPWVFRLYNLLYGLLGFFCLFLLARNNTRSQLKAMAVVLFVFLSPVVIYYLDGFLPSTTSVANALIGYYFFFEYRRNKKFRHLMFAVLFAFLAALSRTPFALILGTMFCQILYDIVRERKLKLKELLPFMVAFGILMGYFIYNRGLANVYGSVFLMNVMSVYDKKEILQILEFVNSYWRNSYFTVYHYWIFLALGIVFIVQWIRRKKLTPFQKQVGFQFIITFIGACAYSFLMIYQLRNHDYYFLDSFYIPCVLYLLLCIDSLELKKQSYKIWFIASVVLLGFLMFLKCNKNMKWRYTEELSNFTLSEVYNYTGSDDYLDSLGIDKDAKILVIKSYSANIPFILMNRTGYIQMDISKDAINESFTWNYDYITIQNDIILSEVVNYYPEIINELEPVGTNGKISIFKKKHREKSLNEFLQLKNELIYCSTSCDGIKDSCIAYLSKDFSCDSSCIIGIENEFVDLFDYELKNNDTDYLNLILKGNFRLNTYDHDNTNLILSIKNGDDLVYYKSFPVNQYLENAVKDDFKRLYFSFPLRYKHGSNTILKLYYWNSGKNEMEMKDVIVVIL